MNTFPLTPTMEVRKSFKSDVVSNLKNEYYFDLFFNKLSDVDKDILYDFIVNNYADVFYFWSKNKYNLSKEGNYFTISNVEFLLAKDSNNEVDNMYINDNVVSYTYDYDNPITLISDTLAIPHLFLMNVQIPLNDTDYSICAITYGDRKCKIRCVKDDEDENYYLVVSTYSENTGEIKNIKLLIKRFYYSIYGVQYSYIQFSIALSNFTVVVGHYNNSGKVEFENKVEDGTEINVEFADGVIVNELYSGNVRVESEYTLKWNTYKYGKSISINVYASSVSLSKSCFTTMEGNIKYTVKFKDDEFRIMRNQDGYYTYLSLKTVQI